MKLYHFFGLRTNNHRAISNREKNIQILREYGKLGISILSRESNYRHGRPSVSVISALHFSISSSRCYIRESLYIIMTWYHPSLVYLNVFLWYALKPCEHYFATSWRCGFVRFRLCIGYEKSREGLTDSTAPVKTSLKFKLGNWTRNVKLSFYKNICWFLKSLF